MKIKQQKDKRNPSYLNGYPCSNSESNESKMESNDELPSVNQSSESVDNFFL